MPSILRFDHSGPFGEIRSNDPVKGELSGAPRFIFRKQA